VPSARASSATYTRAFAGGQDVVDGGALPFINTDAALVHDAPKRLGKRRIRHEAVRIRHALASDRFFTPI
jgi:hypothetical protein